MSEKNILLKIAYDGTNFSGWQRQPGLRTVQGELEAVLSELCRMSVKIDGTSRTDAGVHALGQQATFSGDFGIPVSRIARAANNLLAGNRLMATGDVRILSAEEVPSGFHARFDSKGKKYIYKIRCGGEPDLFLRNYRYQLAGSLDVDAMDEAAKYIVGTHDFKCFQAAGGEEKETTVRTIWELGVRTVGCASGRQIGGACAAAENRIQCADFAVSGVDAAGKSLKPSAGAASEAASAAREIEAASAAREIEAASAAREIEICVCGDGFLYNMVRIITGTLVEVGLGKRKPGELAGIIESKDRSRAGHTAPPQGLYLAEVYY